MRKNLKYFLVLFLSIALMQCDEDSDPKKILPTLSINDATAEEGLSEMFTVTLSEASAEAITFSYKTTDVTATAADYKAITTTQQATFPIGSTTLQIIVDTYTDKEGDEPLETFKIVLSDPKNADLSDDITGTGTIINGAAPYYMTMKVDGQPWTASQDFFFEPTYSTGVYSMAGYGTGAFYDSQLSFNFNENPAGPAVFETTDSFEEDPTKVRIYWSPTFFSDGGLGVDYKGQPGGEVKFTKFNVTTLEAEGTFHFTVKSDDGDEIEITEGEFKIKISDF